MLSMVSSSSVLIGLSTFAYLGAIFSASAISLSFWARVADAGFHRLAWVLLGIGVAFLVLTAADGAMPAIVHGAEASA
jgi:hypothetical protein